MFQKTGIAFGLNILPGFGLGSFIQGDNLGGSLGLVFDILAYSLFGSGIYYVISGTFDSLSTSIAGENDDAIKFKVGLGFLGVGIASFITSKIIGMIFPFTFNYDKGHTVHQIAKIKKSLDNSFGGFSPSFSPDYNEATTIGFQLSFSKFY